MSKQDSPVAPPAVVADVPTPADPNVELAKHYARERALAQAKAAELGGLGAMVKLRAAHGFIQNPTTLAVFDTDRMAEVKVDTWTELQYAAGKLLKV